MSLPNGQESMSMHDMAVAGALAAIPGAGPNLLANLAPMFPKAVPPDYVTDSPDYVNGLRIRCTCGAGATIVFNGVQACEGDCTRVFLRIGSDVRCGYIAEPVRRVA